CNRIGRLNTDGSLEAGFNPGANDDVNAIAVQADGKILFAGRFTQLGGQTRNRIGRLNSDGSLDNSFNPGANGEVDALAVQTDGKILVGGFFSQLGGQGRNNIGRLSPDGSLDPSFNPGTNNGILALAVQTDGKILLGGGFTQLGGQTRNGIGRLNADGSLDMSFTPGANSQIDAIVVQADGKIVLGGGFTQLGGQPRLRLGRLNSDGSLDVVFHPDADNTVFTLAVQADGKILVGGFFSQLSGLSRVGIGRLYPEDAAVDPSFNSGQGGVVALAMQSDGKVLIGGFFTQLGGQPRNNIGRLTNTDAALQNLSVSPDGSTIQWLRSGTGPEVSRVTFEASTDGVNYFLIGSATRIAGGWQLTGVSLPKDQNIFIRARGFYSTGYDGASGSVVESVRNTFLPAPPLFCPCPPAGIISWWPGQNNAQDIVSHYDGTMQNGATFATGMVGQAVSLDGIDDAVVVNNNLGLNPTSITVEAWVKPNSVPVGTLKDVVTKWGFDATRDSYLIGLLNSGSGITIIGGIGDGATGDPGLSGGTVPLNTWSHIAMTYDASSGVNRLYLNGTQVNQRVRANGIFPTTTRVFIGGEDSSQGRFFSGLIDEPTIYSRALTSSEILAIYNAGSNGKPTPIRGTLQLSQVSYSVNEDAGIATVTVTRSGDTSVPTTVKYATSDATDVNFRCNPATQGQIVGAASRKCDYHIASGRLRFAAGETTRTIVISIVNDVYVEGGESFTLTLSSPTGAALGAPNTATVTINDNDNPGQANPIDGTSFFVRMLYVDLLSREPDPLGYAGWVHRIDFCGQAGEPPPPCDRVTVGGDGFLRSTEFFDREFFVIRLYRAGLGRIPRYDDVGDLAYVSGFLTDADLESNKQELVADIMSRSEFGGLYNGLSNGQFVDKLIQTAAVTMPQNVRDGWVTALDNASKTRAVIYRELSERPEVSNRYLHEAQVVSCYYGFFTRNPDGAYFNYLDRLDRGEITLGDLAFAFINAAEYRQRFGP
ncbi:MAG TPA: LamG-like jellyroll fold domain-containing protein, partial [Pyrinomonadaceae bacterium]